MSEDLARTDWANPEAMAHYRGEVEKRAQARLAESPGAKKALEISAPEKAARALYMLSELETPKNEIARRLDLHPMQLDRLIYHHPEAWEKRRPMLAAQFTEASAKLVAAMERKAEMLLADDELLRETPLNHLSIAAGVAVDKAAILNGMATTVIEHRNTGKIEEYEALREAARQRLQNKSIPVEAEILADGPEVAEA